MTSPLDWIASDVSISGCEAGLFWNERRGVYKKNLEFPIIENGFICAPPGSDFIQSWRKSYEECISSPDYESYFLAKPNYSDLIANFEQSRNISYFVCYMAAQETMRRSRNFRLLLINVEDEFYYYYYSTKKPRNRRHFAEALLLTPQSDSDGSRLIKITNGHRSLLDEYLAHRCYRRDSILGQFATDGISD